MNLTLTRFLAANGATLGRLTGLSRDLYTLELPWLNNQPGVSCIPPGTYKCIPHGWEPDTKVEKKQVWEITGVPNRSATLFHIGNTVRDTKGCVLAAMGIQISQTQSFAPDSEMAINYMRQQIGPNEFTLTVK